MRKDRILDQLAERGNVAQFAAFEPVSGRPQHTFSRIAGCSPNMPPGDFKATVSTLFAASAETSVNVRSFDPGNPRSRDFTYGLRSVDEALTIVERLTSEGLHTIVNETVDVNDGGVSGVVQGNTIEFAPDDTPRCVEKPGTAAMSFQSGIAIIETVYGIAPELETAPGLRIEFSIHPSPRGWRASHTLLWEREEQVPAVEAPASSWPNNFSRHIGDKAFGLLIADNLGLFVPRTLVIARRLAPFTFGRATGSKEVWTRTCPGEPRPGLYTTAKGWLDPFRLLSEEDPGGDVIASVLRQDAVDAHYSGAALVTEDGELVIEGRRGEGDGFMLGVQSPEALPGFVVDDVTATFDRLMASLGPVRFEWVHDGSATWVVQLHKGATRSTRTVIVPGEARNWVEFDTTMGLEALRFILRSAKDGDGIMIAGHVGLTSHFGDVLRRAGLPARMAAK